MAQQVHERIGKSNEINGCVKVDVSVTLSEDRASQPAERQAINQSRKAIFKITPYC